MARSRRLVAALLACIWIAPAALAQTPAVPDRELVIGTKVAEPFAIKDAKGQWHGLSIELWRHVAKKLGIKYRFEEATLKELVDGVASGRFDAGVAALTITAAREKRFDFTHPFYSTGLAIAVRRKDENIWSAFGSVFTPRLTLLFGFLVGILVLIGVAVWLIERRTNPEQFGGGFLEGIGKGLWFSASTMTTVGFGDKAPITPLGRFLALIWMIIAIVFISVFTGVIASALTVDQLEANIRGPKDLYNVRVGTVPNSFSATWLRRERVDFSGVDGVEKGLAEVRAGRLDAFVYDEPLLRYLIRQKFRDDLFVVPNTFAPQEYGIALPSNSPLRERINVILLEYVSTRQWRDLQFGYLGQR